MRRLIIQGSAASKRNTHTMVQLLREDLEADFIDLNDYQIGPFDYEFKNQDDDFLPLIRRIVADYDLIIFATPVYWYSMSGTMKIFFDRISDCLKIEKETGRKLRGMYMAALSCGYDQDAPASVSEPFHLSADYLGLHFLGYVHTWMEDDVDEPEAEVKQRIHRFAQSLQHVGP